MGSTTVESAASLPAAFLRGHRGAPEGPEEGSWRSARRSSGVLGYSCGKIQLQLLVREAGGENI